MAVREILIYPNPVLREHCVPVPEGDARVETWVSDLVDTLSSSPGIALSAPQLGVLYRMVIVHVPEKKGGSGLRVLLNPRITQLDSHDIFREGCLSIPDFLGNVMRARFVRVSALNTDFTPVELCAKGLEAVALQHEIDHLDGVLFLDRVNSLKTDIFRRKR